jgi:hypothetical protein
MWHTILYRCRAQNMRIAEFRQAGALGMQRHGSFKCYRAEIGGRAAGGTIHETLVKDVSVWCRACHVVRRTAILPRQGWLREQQD